MTKKELEYKIQVLEHELNYYSKIYPGSKKEKLIIEKLKKEYNN